MNTKTLNVKYLKSLNACKSGIEFVVNNGLEDFPIDNVKDNVEGDFDGF